MPTINLTDPVNGTLTDASVIAANNQLIESVVNGGLDDNNLASTAAIQPQKLKNFPNDAAKLLLGDGTWGALGGTAQKCHLRRATTYTVVTGPATFVPFDVEDFDNDTMHDLVAAPSRITIKTAGLYMIYGRGLMTGGGTQAGLYLRQNGSIYVAQSIAQGVYQVATTPVAQWNVVVNCIVGDYFEMGTASNTSNATLTPVFGAYRLV